jgi:chromosome segregation ATPase
MENKFIEWFKKAKPWFDSLKEQIESNQKLLKEINKTLKEQEKIINDLIKKEKKAGIDSSQKFKKVRHELDMIKNDVGNISTAINSINKSRIVTNGRK